MSKESIYILLDEFYLFVNTYIDIILPSYEDRSFKPNLYA